MHRLLFACLACALLAACAPSAPVYEPAAERTGEVSRAAPHYVDLDDAGALAAYLRTGAPFVSAHRGYPTDAYPENALATFEHALRFAPALLETDVRLTADSVLVLLHDTTLDRTTTGTGPLDEHTLAELRPLRLVTKTGRATPYRIPTLAEALAWAEGRAILQLDVKRGVPPARVVQLLQRMDALDRAVVIVYTLDALRTYHRLAPSLVLSASAGTAEELDAVLATDIPTDRLLVFTGVGTLQPDLVARLDALGIPAIVGTFGAMDTAAQTQGLAVYQTLLAAGIDILATDDLARAVQALEATPEPADR